MSYFARSGMVLAAIVLAIVYGILVDHGISDRDRPEGFRPTWVFWINVNLLITASALLGAAAVRP